MICRDLSETQSIKINDAEFTIGVISRKAWRDIQKNLRISGQFSKKNEGKVFSEIEQDPEFEKANEALTQAYRDMVQYGIKDHKGINNSKGQPIPCNLSGGFLSQETLDLYEVNGLLIKLGTEVLNFNVMTVDDQKN